MRSPDQARASEAAALHLATVEDPNPAPAAAPATEATDAAPLAETRSDDALAVTVEDPDESSMLPAFALLATVASAWVASKWGPQWMVTEERATRIGRALVRVAQKYLPGAEEYGPELELVVALGDYGIAGLGPAMLDSAAAQRAEQAQLTPKAPPSEPWESPN
jgi:hypothetical protein